MFSYIKDIFNYLMNNNDDTDDQDREKFLAHELVDLDIQAQKEAPITTSIERDTPSDAVCFKKTGLITYCENNIVLIDGAVYYDKSNCSLKLNVNDKVLYLGYNDSNDRVVIVRILGNLGLSWGDAEEAEEDKFRVVEHVLIGHVARRQDRFIYISESDLKFNLDDVEGTFVPIEGDWLEIICSVQEDSIRPFNISTDQVLKVIAFNALRTKIKTGIVTQWSGNSGVCDKQIYIDNRTVLNGIQPVLGSKVLVEAIESNQGSCTWRAIKLMVASNGTTMRPQNLILNEEQISLDMEVQKNIEMTHPIKFDQICFQQTHKLILNITNRSNQLYVMNKWIILSKKRNSQIEIKPYINQSIKLDPGQKLSFTVTCMPKFFGQSKESLVLLFKGFQLKRIIEINVIENKQILSEDVGDNYNQKKEVNKVVEMKKIRDNDESYIAGVKPYKLSAFVDVRIGDYSIPDKIWTVLLGDSGKMTLCNDFNNLLAKIEMNFPFLSQNLTINNYIDKWHTLLWMDEVQANLNMRIYDNSKAFLMRCDEYLGIEITGLTEKRPSLIKGDRAIVRDVRNPNASRYEGYIHCIRGNLVLLKFSQYFHDSYNGGDVSIEFHFSRTMFRRSHHAINLALSNLGPDILFPTRIKIKSPQISDEKLGKIKWFNTTLNSIQKNAIINILKGECRPMPYVIFGPPGTGKTVTLIETILQILTMVPESRIMVATPSNSAANLITERLIQYKGCFTGSIARMIANYLLDSESIPSTIKPYCVHFDISAENRLDKIQNSYQKTHICRHRVTIGTCYCLGMFLHLKLPKGHFTHIIIDESGQATEPEIMLPMNFIHKEHGQIILAGDPMQLGPIILSKYCKDYGMDESFLCRLLDRFPYLKDYHSFQNGFDNRLVTMLNENYRSLKEIIKLSSDMFYDGKLVARIDESMPWTFKFIQATCEIFESSSKTGGIFVFGIKGDNARAVDSPSWYNPQEAAMVALTACKLYKRRVTADEIGIITPYLAQVKYLRVLFSSMGLPIPKIGTVEDFQGQERPIILISTVRSTESLLQEDSKQSLGFVGNPKRFNVALTRAQISTVIFCNPYLLSKDPSWKKVIENAVSTEKYMGCDLPFEFDNTVNNTY